MMELDFAGMWAVAVRHRLPRAKEAKRSPGLERWDDDAEAASAMLALYLALKHADTAIDGAPYLERPAIEVARWASLFERAEHFRDALMHLGDKAERGRPAVLPAPDRNRPTGYVSMGIGFDDGYAWLYAPGPRRAGDVSRSTRVAWSEVERAADWIEAWAREILTRGWDDLQARYLAHGGQKPPSPPV
jgi:hypothetical protein